MLTGSVVFDLTDAKPDRMRHRVAALPDVPTGARVVLRVGALAPEPDVIRVVALHEQPAPAWTCRELRTPCRLWLGALRDNFGEVLV